MGEYNVEIRKHLELKEELLNIACGYSEIANKVISDLRAKCMVCLPEIFMVNPELSVTMDIERKNFETFVAFVKDELGNTTITGKGEFIHNGKKYISYDTISVAVHTHIRYLESIFSGFHIDKEKTNCDLKRYIDFMKEYLLTKKSSIFNE